MKLRVSLLGKVHGLFVRHGLTVKREVPDQPGWVCAGDRQI